VSARSGGSRSAAAWLFVVVAAIGLSLARPGDGTAQLFVNRAALDPVQPNMVNVRVGADYAFVVGVGYSRGLAVGGRTLLLSGSLTAPWADADLGDYDVRIGATLDLVGRSRWGLVGGLGSSLRGTTNELGRLRSVAVDGVLVGGHWSPRWFATVEGGYDGAIATHLDHSDHYRSTHYADARDGWYGDAGSNLRLGVAGGVSFGRYDLVLRAGQARDREGHPQLLPAYATLDLNVRF
jgi:hypothetical protein